MFFLELLVFVLIMYFVIRPFYAVYLFVRPPRLRISFFTPTNLGVTYEDITLTSPDGVPLVGWYIPSRNTAAVILLHGHSGNRLGVVHHAEALVQAGYGVLMFDLRAHGSSGGRRFATSQAGVDDVLTAVAYLSKRPDVNPAGIGVMGVSVGGVFALHAAVQTVAIRAVAVDGISPAALADLPAPTSLWRRFNIWQQRLMAQMARRYARQSPLPPNQEVVKKLGKRPLFFIATGSGDEAAMLKNLAAAAETAELWQLPEARHAQGWHERPDEYSHRLVAFFDGALARQDNTRITLPPLPEAMPVLAEVQQIAADGPAADSPAAHSPAAHSPAPDISPAIDYEATISMTGANFTAFLMLPLAFGLFWGPFYWVWGLWPFVAFFELSFSGTLTLLLVFALSILVHELLHAVGFWLVGGAPLHQIHFGFNWAGLAPFAHCPVPLRASAYRLTVLLPGLVLGVIPGLLGVAMRLPLLVMWSTLMLLAAGGDAAVLWAVRQVPGSRWVQDHPSKPGCRVLAE